MNKSHFSSLLVPTQVLETQNRQKRYNRRLALQKDLAHELFYLDGV